MRAFNAVASFADYELQHSCPPLPAVVLNPRSSFNHTNGPGLKLAAPPKQLIVSRLAFATSKDEVLGYIKCKLGALSLFSSVKLTKDRNSDRVISFFYSRLSLRI